jgi:hypothetical protein
VNFDRGLPFFDHGTHFVIGKIHAIEVSQAVFALDILRNSSLNFLNAASSFYRSTRLTSNIQPLRPSENFGSLSPLYECLSSVPHIEHGWCYHIIPIFFRKWINHFFLLGSLLAAFCKALVLACSVLLREPKGPPQPFLL